ncbi:hypothetical protein AAHA92_29190 [Salvia divinorum]|uniref:Uncharacterized protein n=1 Tax=Salvia divinorum TaxID=28513 RepID=A0ABD1G045_SALDI
MASQSNLESTQDAPPTVAIPVNFLEELFKQIRPDLIVGEALAFLSQAPATEPQQSQETTPSAAQQILEGAAGEVTGEVETTPTEAVAEGLEIIASIEAEQVLTVEKPIRMTSSELMEVPAGSAEKEAGLTLAEKEMLAEQASMERELARNEAEKDASPGVEPSREEMERRAEGERDVIPVIRRPRSGRGTRPRKPTPIQTDGTSQKDEQTPHLEEVLSRGPGANKEAKGSRQGKKRKGKLPAEPESKRERMLRDENTDEEMEAEKGAEGEENLTVPSYKKFLVNLDSDMLQRMTTFEDEAEATLLEYISGIGFDWLLGTEAPDVPEILAQEFFTTFLFKNTFDLQKKSISFRIFGTEMRMNLTEWSVRLGLFTEEQAEAGEWVDREIGKPKANRSFDPHAVYLGYNLLGKANLTAPVTMVELYFMWCMKEQKKVHLDCWLAHACHAIAIHPNLQLHTCHILGELVRRNFQITLSEGLPQLPKCPAPEDLNLNLLMRLKFLRVVDRETRFYTIGQPITIPSSTLALQYREENTREVSEALTQRNEWRNRMEAMVATLVENSTVTRKAIEEQKQLIEAQNAQLAKVVGSLEKSVSLPIYRLPLQQRQRQEQTSMVPYEQRRQGERSSSSSRETSRRERRRTPPPPPKRK